MLATDAFGGYGGIALYNRDVMTALSDDTQITSVVAVARWCSQPLEALPTKVEYHTGGTRNWLAYVLEAFRYAMQGRFDAIICCHINLVPIAWILGKVLRVPIILQIYGLEAWQPTSWSLTNYLVKKVDVIVSISRFTLGMFTEWAALKHDRCFILPNAVHLDEYDPEVSGARFRQLFDLGGRKVLLTFGRLVSRERAKGFDEVLEILPALKEEFPELSYLIAGDGPDQVRLQHKATELGVADIVHFTGMVDEHQKNELYCASDLFVMPSRGEGFGFVFLEALACGLPSIGSTADGSREALLHGELGQLVDPDDPDALKAAIRRGLTRPKNVPARLSHFGFPNFTARLHDIMSATLAGAK